MNYKAIQFWHNLYQDNCGKCHSEYNSSSSLARQPFVSPGLPQNYSPFLPIVGLSSYSFFGFLNNLILTAWSCWPHVQPPTWRISVSLFVWLLPLDPSGLGGPTSSNATAGIALRVSGALKPHHHDKVGIASVGWIQLKRGKSQTEFAYSFVTICLCSWNSSSFPSTFLSVEWRGEWGCRWGNWKSFSTHCH
jgi:hypothetical protein